MTCSLESKGCSLYSRGCINPHHPCTLHPRSQTLTQVWRRVHLEPLLEEAATEAAAAAAPAMEERQEGAVMDGAVAVAGAAMEEEPAGAVAEGAVGGREQHGDAASSQEAEVIEVTDDAEGGEEAAAATASTVLRSTAASRAASDGHLVCRAIHGGEIIQHTSCMLTRLPAFACVPAHSHLLICFPTCVRM